MPDYLSDGTVPFFVWLRSICRQKMVHLHQQHIDTQKRSVGREQEAELPLADETADRILLVHMLEWSERSRTLLREIWRVLGPGGRLLIVVPNRRGLWARVDTTPFGYGSPFSRSQLTQLLKECMFDPEGWQYALYMPPFNWRVLMRWPTFWERLGLFLWPIFSGVIVVEATKQVYAAMPAREAERKMRRRIVPVPAGVAPRKTAD